MILVPDLSALDRSERATPVAPPRSFKPLGDFHYARIAGSMPPGIGTTTAQRNGVRYEHKVQRWLTRQLGPSYLLSPRIEVFTFQSVLRTLVPDGLYLSEDMALVVEIKHQHVPESWWQLRGLYGPAVKRLPLVCHVNLLTIVKSFDPAVSYPEPVERVWDVADFAVKPCPRVGVLEWR